MSIDDSFQNMIDRLGDGEECAAADVFQRYAERLIRLARTKLDGRLRGKVDPEDVAQSVMKSFFSRHADGRFELKG